MKELVGITASCFVLICFTFNDERKIRIFDAIGAGLYVCYGLMIGSFSNVFMNSVLIIIQLYKLYNIKKRRFKNDK